MSRASREADIYPSACNVLRLFRQVTEGSKSGKGRTFIFLLMPGSIVTQQEVRS